MTVDRKPIAEQHSRRAPEHIELTAARRHALGWCSGLALLGWLGLPGLSRATAAQPRVQAAAAPAPVGAAGPTGATRSPRPIFVLNSQDATVSVIDPVTWTEQRRIEVGKEPHHLYLTPDEKSLIVANATGNSLTFIDPATGAVQRTVRDIVDPYHLRFSPDMKWFVTAANRLNHVDLYRWQPADAQPFKLVKRIEAPKTPSHLFIDSRSTVVYASLQDSDELIAIDLATQAIRWKIKTGKMPADVFLTKDDKHLLVGLTGDRFVEVYDVSGAAPSLVKRLATGDGAHAFRARGDGRHVFVSNRVANTISMIDLQTFEVAAQLPGPGGPDCMEVMADGRTLLLSSRWARKLSVIDIEQRKVLRQVAVGRSPHGVWTLDHAARQ
jgi:YVTN family beta-propeller protein